MKKPAYTKYTPDYIRKIREYWGLSYANMHRLLGFGANQWRLYEQGRPVTNRPAYLLIKMTTTPGGMIRLLELVPEETRKIMHKQWIAAYEKASKDREEIRLVALQIEHGIEESWIDKKLKD